MTKLEQVNGAYKKALARVLLKLFPNTIITVSDVLIDPSYKHGRVWVRADAQLLKQLNSKHSQIQSSILRHVKMRYTPSLTFLADDNLLEHLDELYKEIEPNAN